MPFSRQLRGVLLLFLVISNHVVEARLRFDAHTLGGDANLGGRDSGGHGHGATKAAAQRKGTPSSLAFASPAFPSVSGLHNALTPASPSVALTSPADPERSFLQLGAKGLAKGLTRVDPVTAVIAASLLIISLGFVVYSLVKRYQGGKQALENFDEQQRRFICQNTMHAYVVCESCGGTGGRGGRGERGRGGGARVRDSGGGGGTREAKRGMRAEEYVTELWLAEGR